MGRRVDSVQALAVLYDLALVIGSEVTVDALLTRTLQRFLYHTGFPAGIVYSHRSSADDPGWVEVRLDAAVGSYELVKRCGEWLRLPTELTAPAPILAERPDLLATLSARTAYCCYLHLPIAGFGGMLLLNAAAPASALPLTDLFLPIMARLATAIRLCQGIEERTAALRAANRELEAFAYSVSHDLRAPLRAIDGYAAILAEEHAPALGEDGRGLLSRVRSNAKRMERLIEDVLAFSRTGRREMSAAVVDMAALAREVAAELGTAAEGRLVRFEIGDLPGVEGDRSMLRQVWINLLSNAVKFTRYSPQALIEVDASTAADMNVYRVRDNGVGFDMAAAGKLFGVFERLHSGSEFEGTGIGLAIVKRIVERHGGRVWAEGQPGAGAQFHFSLPRQRSEA